MGLLLLLPGTAQAASSSSSRVELRASAGTMSMFQVGMWGVLPLSPTVAADVDLARLVRLHAEYGFSLADPVHRAGLAAGVAIPLVGVNAADVGGLQIKLPLLGEAGLLVGETEANDGYEDELRWVLVGPTTGVDFTWWSATSHVGFYGALTAAYKYRIEAGSEYSGEYSMMSDEKGTAEAAMRVGVAF